MYVFVINKIIFIATSSRFSLQTLFRFLKDTYSKEGIIQLWRGNTATLFRIYPYAAIQYSAHEKYKHLLGIDKINTNHL